MKPRLLVVSLLAAINLVACQSVGSPESQVAETEPAKPIDQILGAGKVDQPKLADTASQTGKEIKVKREADLRQNEATAGIRFRSDEAQKQNAAVAESVADFAVAASPVSAPPPPPAMVQAYPSNPNPGQYWEAENRENYADHKDNAVIVTAENPVSTFSIDVDTGAYSNVRRMLNQGQLPPHDAVRAEEFINYFDYGFPSSSSRQTPFSVSTELAAAPWNKDHGLLMVGIKGFEIDPAKIPASNLVFLIDTSGSMQSPDKIDLLKDAFKQMVPRLREQDRVSIVVYAGSAGLVLPPTSGAEQNRIMQALDGLSAGGSTNGGEGIQLAYAMAKQAFIKNGVNRVILATDGDFNVGTTDLEALKTMVSTQRESGVALTTLGFGQGNYNDELSEQLADIGNGNHFYIDTLNEARKVLNDELSATMMTIAKDVKIQIEFNPTVVAEYRLIGYENRVLNREDFNNDKIDAGEIGAGHDVTALYEITFANGKGRAIDPLRYGKGSAQTGNSNELAFLKLRYKQPDADKSTLIERPVLRSQFKAQASERMKLAAGVAAFADNLRGGTHLGDFGLAQIKSLVQSSKVPDPFGYRMELLDLIDRTVALKPTKGGQDEVAIAQ